MQSQKVQIEAYDLELRLLSEAVEVEYRWLRRIVKDGLSRRGGRLDRLTRHLGLPDGDYLWAADIKQFLPHPPKPEQLSTLKQKLAWPYAERLLDLLETGSHEYLKDLIDRLHKFHLSHPAGGSNYYGPANSDPLVGGERIQAVQDVRLVDPSESPRAEPASGMSPAATLADRIRSREKSAHAY
ncbi:hypothetical protein [Planctomyces sp. SH-PL62]|uniref:hypothetical protein n=1 Tax=Planctomyces sp. SH-PL62 TaxID=1636152 RepID=UPI000837E829|nr:hypothetical protein [Planctomyces sp. SH-PL62]